MLTVKNGAVIAVPFRAFDSATGLVEQTAVAFVVATDVIVQKADGVEYVGVGTITETGNGTYLYHMTAAETNVNGGLLVRVVHAGIRTLTEEIQVNAAADVQTWRGAVPADLATGWVVADMPFDVNNLIAFYLQTMLDMMGPLGVLAVSSATRNSVTFEYFGTPPAPADLFKGMSVVHSPDLQSVFGPGRIGQLRSVVSSTPEVVNSVTLTVTPNWLEIPAVGTTLIIVYASGNANQKLGSQDMVLYRRAGGQLVKVDDIALVQP